MTLKFDYVIGAWKSMVNQFMIEHLNGFLAFIFCCLNSKSEIRILINNYS